MSFLYYTASDDVREIDYIRFRINDTVEGNGPLPNDCNFSDEELTMTIASEGGSWQRGVAACFEALHAAWSKHPSYTADGLSISQSHVADEHAKSAQFWRKLYGGATGATAHARTVTRVDGYSQDIPATQVDDVTY